MKLIVDYQYFGNVNLYSALCKSTHIIFEQCEQYQKSSFRNKMVLPTPQGVLQLSIPIKGGRACRLPTTSVSIDYSKPWQKVHIKTIDTLYNRSPWYEYYKNDLYELYQTKPTYLAEWNYTCIKWVIYKLKFTATMTVTTEFKLQYPVEEFIDYRTSIKKKSTITEDSNIVYHQVHEHIIGFIPNMCILDVLFCEGPNAINILNN